MMKFNKKYMILGIFLLIGLIGITFAFFYYYREGAQEELVSGQIYLKMDETAGNLTITNAFPETPEEARSRTDNVVTFTINGKNTSEKTIYYEVMLSEGDDNPNYTTRISVEHLRFDLKEIIGEDETLVIDNGTYTELKETRIWVDTVEPNTDSLSIKYELRVWISEDVLISDTDPEADYPAKTWKDTYASVKVSVFGDFEEKELANTIPLNTVIEDTLTLTTADADGTRYVTGTNPNNYVWYSGKLWRIVALNEDGTVKLVTQNAMTTIAWDTSSTNTDYSTSQIRKWLENEFLPTINKDLIVESTWDDTTYESLPTKKNNVTNPVTDKVGLLTIYDYAMTGGTIHSDTSNTYLNNGYYWWTMSPKTSVWSVNSNGYASGNGLNTSIGVRPSVNLKSGIQIEDNGANGSKEMPYQLTDNSKGKTNDSLNTRISGEYIKFNNVLYRIVGTEEVNGNLLTKVTMADYSMNENSIGEMVIGENMDEATFSLSYGMGLYLENWYNADSTNTTYASTYINNTYKKMIATANEGVVWYVGPNDGIEYDYTKAKDGTPVSSTIGLGRYGEMFSSQFGDDSGETSNIWLITKYIDPNVWYINNQNYAYDNSPDSFLGVRPSFYLKSDVKIVSGTGLPNDPYEITQ